MGMQWDIESSSSSNPDYDWNWGTSPQLVAIGTSPSTILSASNQPRLISYRVEADPSIKVKLWKNAPTTGPYELDSYGGQNIERWELMSGLKASTVSGTANIIVNTASRIVV